MAELAEVDNADGVDGDGSGNVVGGDEVRLNGLVVGVVGVVVVCFANVELLD
jgi:hypothetical protein